MRIREAVEESTSYDSGRGDAPIRMDKNESPFPLPAKLKRRVVDELTELAFNRYPNSSADRLRTRLANFHGLKKENVIAGSGSDQLISYATRLFAGNHVVIAPPTFSMYRFYSELAGFEVKAVELGEDFGLNPEGIKSRLDGAALIFLCSPNNPTGNRFKRETLVELLKTGKPLVLDEAYVEFSGESQRDLIEEFENLIVLRTFSKAFGLAGARVGYGLADEGTVEKLLRVKPPYNLSSISARTAGIALENYEPIRERVGLIVEERERIYEEFEEFAHRSRANFLLMDLDAGDYLRERGIAVREFSGGLDGKIRVTVGTEEENDRLIAALKDFVRSKVGEKEERR